MVRKRRAGPAASSPAALLLLLLCVLLNIANGYRKVGCLFSKNICKPDVEDCYYDNAFGRCLVFDENLKEDDLYQYDLAPEELDVVRVELERLEYQGYKWSHDYTQCVMQIILDDLRYGTHNNVEELCKHLRLSGEPTYKLDNRLLENELNDGNLREDEEGAAEEAEEGPLAMIKFTPSRTNPHGEFADEFYYPPDVRQRMTEERRKAKISLDNYEEGLYDKLSSYEPAPNAVYRRGSRSLSKKSLDYGLPQEYMNVMRRFLADETTNDDQLDFIPTADDKKTLIIDDDDDDDDGDETDDEEDAEDYEKTFARKYKQARQMQAADFLGRVENDYDAGDSEEEDEENEEDDNKGYGEQNQLQEAIDSQLTQANDPYYDRTVPPLLRGILQSDYDDLTLRDGLLWGRDATGFKRRERLDVKKPGPLFSTNNYAFKTQSPSASDYDSSDENEKENEVRFSPVKKEVHDSQSNNAASPSHENVDLNYVYIQFKQNINSWSEGNKIVKTVAELIGLKARELNVTEVGRAEVTFKVSKNSQDLNATQIVNKIADAREDLQKKLKVDIIRAGIANNKTKLPAMLEVSRAPEMELRLFGVLVGMGVVAACAGAFVLLMIARRHAKSRAKLAGLRTPDPEASSDYQELCRARMQAKQSDKQSESPKGFDFGRLLESGRSESNRSSTSSWSEEPPNSSIDVATGHVVLSYMEDHLKNQEKLDEEWAALCAYEAEPCSTAIAENNADRNRPGASLPYDHSRVILNELANLKSSDYINASTITDHDPRNPAYIATQGPLPQTTADFWQLVWEQGSVVIVMLTKLTEEGHAMCHRYWPDEGSEIYHIYEIHIVSEHIWCDDYLVRSFYLKNLRTGETRTVTQFHFQSWPHEGVPKSTKALLEFRRKVNKSYRGRSCPIIVHCSDGAGRTGTYCLIDMLLNRMSKGAKEIDLAATLEHIRDQRPGMVANKKQFEFVLMAVAEEVHAILKTLPSVADKSAADKQPTKSDK